MADRLRILLELGRKRRVVAGAIDWPGLDRWGSSDEDAIAKLLTYVPRYEDVAARAGLASEFDGVAAADVEVVERGPGNSSTDFWGVAHVPSQFETDVLSPIALERRLDLLQACWAWFDDGAAGAPAELTLGPRGGGRSRDQIIRHVYLNEPGQYWRKVEVRTPSDIVMTPEGMRDHHRAYLDAIRAYNAEGRPARTWPIQFLVRRTAQHVMDHGWEIEDRVPAG